MDRSGLPFAKMHGCLNDYVVVDAEHHAIPDAASLALAMCDRRSGVGADGLLLVSRSAAADFRMRIFNGDGSEAEMCGNGLRCAALFAVRLELCGAGPRLSAETGAGVLAVVLGADGRVTVDMGAPGLDAEPTAPLRIGDREVLLTEVRMGNPHAVVFVPSVRDAAVEDWGRRIESHERFPTRTNVEFVEVLARDRVRQRTWERGCGETPACGTGACAVVVAGALTGRTERWVRVSLTGGNLEVEWGGDGHVRLTGPAQHVFDGQWQFGGGDP